MAYRRDILRSLGGFNPVYTAAGDDVDMCWRVLGAGYRIGFNAGAVVYHHRRPSVRRYLRQQRGYGHAEVILQEHHPERFNALGGIRWAGSLYDGPLHRLDAGRRVQYGEYGAGLFQSVYYPYWTGWVGLALTPEWYAVTLAAAAVAMALAWAAPMVAFLLGLAAFGGVSCTLAVSGQAALRAARREPGEFATRLAHGALVFLLHLLQPISRATGRISGTGFRAGPAYDEFGSVAAPGYWGDWVDRPGFLNRVSGRLRRVCLGVSSGDGFQRWDLEVTGLPFMTVRLFTAVHDQTVLRHRLSYGITPWFWLVLAPVLLAFTADIADPASAFTVNLAISVLSGLFLLRQRLRYRRLIGGVIDDAAREMGLIPLWPEGARERRPATTTT
jgi:hypothetical protein